MPSLISTTTPLTASQEFDSTVQSLTRAVQITGSVFADQPGTLYVEQSGDGINFDTSVPISVPASTGVKIEVDVVSQFFRVRYVNNTTTQTAFRLYVDIRDPYGQFLLSALNPSSGGAWLVLYSSPQGWQVVGRFDGLDGWNANGNAAISTKTNGKYASILVSAVTVSQETLTTNSTHGPAAF